MTTMSSGQDPDDNVNEATRQGGPLQEMEEPKNGTDRRFVYIILQGFTPEHRDVRLMARRDPDFGLEIMQLVLRYLYLDEVSRKKNGIAGHGAVMTTDSKPARGAAVICHNCTINWALRERLCYAK